MEVLREQNSQIKAIAPTSLDTIPRLIVVSKINVFDASVGTTQQLSANLKKDKQWQLFVVAELRTPKHAIEIFDVLLLRCNFIG